MFRMSVVRKLGLVALLALLLAGGTVFAQRSDLSDENPLLGNEFGLWPAPGELRPVGESPISGESSVYNHVNKIPYVSDEPSISALAAETTVQLQWRDAARHAVPTSPEVQTKISGPPFGCLGCAE